MIKQAIDQNIKIAMLNGDKVLVSILRGIKSVILYTEITERKRGEGLNEGTIISILQKEAKKRDDASKLYSSAGEKQKAAQELFEREVILGYLPKQMSKEQVDALVEEVINDLTDTPSMQDIGRIINLVKDKSKGGADGALIARAVKERLMT